MALVVHIAAHADWETQREGDAYTHPSLDEDGFVHCATPEQAAGVVAAAGVPPDLDLVLLCVDTDQLTSEVRWEGPARPEGVDDVATDEQYPHVYGPLDTDAVVDVVPFPVGEDSAYYVPKRVFTLAEEYGTR